MSIVTQHLVVSERATYYRLWLGDIATALEGGEEISRGGAKAQKERGGLRKGEGVLRTRPIGKSAIGEEDSHRGTEAQSDDRVTNFPSVGSVTL
jgi:hypothetical protein